MDKYQTQANEFCKKYNVQLTSKFKDVGFYFSKSEQQACYIVTIERGNNKFTIEFKDSIHNYKRAKTNNEIRNKQIKPYEILYCLQKYQVTTFEEFCADYGYNEDSIHDEKIYNLCKKEWEQVNNMFSDCLEDLQDIQ